MLVFFDLNEKRLNITNEEIISLGLNTAKGI